MLKTLSTLACLLILSVPVFAQDSLKTDPTKPTTEVLQQQITELQSQVSKLLTPSKAENLKTIRQSLSDTIKSAKESTAAQACSKAHGKFRVEVNTSNGSVTPICSLK